MTNLATTSAYSFTIDPQLLFAAQNALTSTHNSQQTTSTTTMAMQMQRSRTYLNSSHPRTAPMCTFQEWTEVDQPGVFRIFTIISVLTILVMLVVLGNALVIAAVILRRRLRSATGLLILSLAVADLMVGLFILPFSIANEVLNSYWIFGDTWCTAWLTMDIWMCTASIYNLVAISIDRYIAIIKPLNYPMLITKFRARCIVAAVWIGSFIICSPSFLLASTERKGPAGEGDMAKLDDGCACNPSNSGMAYIVFSASSSFYIPMVKNCIKPKL
uniref:G-protein coupled receptors family 1 profile domain-containing protein n=1 Tax=Ditylenchus dipsaci TaxID=166011 RepID=A0A915DI73_9BILA